MVTYCSVISLSVKEDGMRKVERLKKKGMYVYAVWMGEWSMLYKALLSDQ